MSDKIGGMSEIPKAKNFGSALAALERRLSLPLPGRAAMMDIAPSQRPFLSVAEARAQGSREGAALVLIYPLDERPHTVLTLRDAGLRDHAGQVSFPGGRREPGEAPPETALREAWEELAIPLEAPRILGSLTPLHIPPSAFLLHPILAAADRRPDFVAQPSEVAAVIEAPLDLFLDPASLRIEDWLLRGERRRIPFFQVGEYKVWGATAMILRELSRLWEEVWIAERDVTQIGAESARPSTENSP
jgi:8-oxo-dGTP pyrophosphatase MutT (NUDIX family)